MLVTYEKTIRKQFADIFYEKILQQGGGAPPQMPLTIRKDSPIWKDLLGEKSRNRCM